MKITKEYTVQSYTPESNNGHTTWVGKDIAEANKEVQDMLRRYPYSVVRLTEHTYYHPMEN